MKIAIFGATGSVGQHLLLKLPEQGHQLTAFSRSVNKIAKLGRDIRVIKGDVTDPTSVAEAVAGQDAVVCLLGAPLRDQSLIRTRGTQVIVDAMHAAGVKRIVCLSAFGAGLSWPYLPWLYRAVLAPLVLGRMFHDHSGQEAILRESRLDWVIVRPGNFDDGFGTQPYLHGRTETARVQKLSLKISRADLADFISRQITSDTYSRDAAWVSYQA